MNLWGFFLFCFFVMALFFKVKAVYIALFTLSLLYFGGGMLLDRGFSRLRVERSSGRTYLFPGEHGELAVRFVNGSFVPFTWLSVHDHMPAQLARGKPRRWVTSIAPLGYATYTYTVTSSRRGVYTVGPVDLIAGDPLGLHQRSGAAQNFHDVIVYPEILTLPELGLPSDLPIGNVKARSPISHDPARIAGIRAYTPGDVQQLIHWKATARTGEMQVKQHEHTLNLDVFLILNMGESDYIAADGTYLNSEISVTTAAALANHLVRKGESFGFVTNASLVRYRAEGEAPEHGGAALAAAAGRGVRERVGGVGHDVIRVPPRKGSRQLMRVLEILAGAELGATQGPASEESAPSFHKLVADEAKNYGWGATLLIVTPKVPFELIETSIMLRRSGYKVSIFVTGGGRMDVPPVDRSALGPVVYRVRQQRDRTLNVEAAGGGAAIG